MNPLVWLLEARVRRALAGDSDTDVSSLLSSVVVELYNVAPDDRSPAQVLGSLAEESGKQEILKRWVLSQLSENLLLRFSGNVGSESDRQSVLQVSTAVFEAAGLIFKVCSDQE